MKNLNVKLFGAIMLFFIGANASAQAPNWQDSYAVDGKCYCNSSNYDHGLSSKDADTPIGRRNVVDICEDIKSVLGSGPTSGRIPYNDIQCGNGPANDADDETYCPGRVDIGEAGCFQIGPKWDLVSVYGPWPGGNGEYVSMRKSNSLGFAIDGNGGGANAQNVYLWSYNSNNQNQHWEEISRGGDYYSYKKRGTNFCLDGDSGGANGQNVYLWTCSDNNHNQHWKKVYVSGQYRLEKRNAPEYSMDGNRGGANRQNLYLWRSNNANQNQLWEFTPHQ